MNRIRNILVTAVGAASITASLLVLSMGPSRAGRDLGPGGGSPSVAEPFQITVQPTGSFGSSSFTVPKGYRLRIEHISAYAFSNYTSDQFDGLGVDVTFDGKLSNVYMPLTSFGVYGGEWTLQEETLLYASEGSKVSVYYADYSGPSSAAVVTITGHLEPIA